jgi:hypothetical protein
MNESWRHKGTRTPRKDGENEGRNKARQNEDLESRLSSATIVSQIIVSQGVLKVCLSRDPHDPAHMVSPGSANGMNPQLGGWSIA